MDWLPIVAFGASLLTGKWWIFGIVIILEIFWFLSFNEDLGKSGYQEYTSDCSDPENQSLSDLSRENFRQKKHHRGKGHHQKHHQGKGHR
jgi:hypothetical protein